MTRRFVIGSRGSALALKQTELIRRELKKKNPGCAFTIRVIRTAGDKDRSLSVFDHKATGVFTKEIEKNLLKKHVDFAVHSLKDLPTTLPKGLVLGACFKREDPRDCLVTRDGRSLASLKPRARVGTTSIRRERQLLLLRNDLRILPLRGNLDTRIGRVLSGELDAVVIAQAGLNRLGKHARHARAFDAQKILPCVSQGILALEVRSNDKEALTAARKINNPAAEYEARAERALLKTLHGGCRVPVGAIARFKKGRLTLEAAVFSARSSRSIRAKAAGADPEKIGKALALKLIKKGAKGFLDEARR